MARSNKLTDRQKQILDCIRIAIRDTGYPPSVREIGEITGLKSPSSVHSHLKALTRKGYLTRNGSSARALVVNEDLLDDELSVHADDVIEETADEEALRNVVAVPLVGRVAAGAPILAEENIEDTMGLPKQLVGDENSFMLTVSGESMIEAGILDGDVVVVKEQSTANNGDIVVAMIDDSATVKTFYREADCIRLQPQNSSMEPIYTTDAVILGKVTALFRSL